jgi:hypothetical protein
MSSERSAAERFFFFLFPKRKLSRMETGLVCLLAPMPAAAGLWIAHPVVDRGLDLCATSHGVAGGAVMSVGPVIAASGMILSSLLGYVGLRQAMANRNDAG